MSTVSIGIKASDPVPEYGGFELPSDGIGVHIHQDVWVKGTREELHRWVLAVVKTVYEATKVTKIASPAAPAPGTEATPPAVSPTPPAGRSDSAGRRAYHASSRWQDNNLPHKRGIL